MNSGYLLIVVGDSRDKSNFNKLVLLSLMILFGLAFVNIFAVPETYDRYTFNEYCDGLYCDRFNVNYSTSVILNFTNISKFNKFLELKLSFSKRDTYYNSPSKVFNINYSYHIIGNSNISKYNNTGIVYCSQYNTICEAINLFKLKELKHNNFKIRIDLETEEVYKYSDYMYIDSYLINKQFSIFIIITNYVYLLINIIIILLYANNLLTVKKFKLEIPNEQKIILLLLCMLVFFNNPLYILYVMYDNFLIAVLCVIFKALFLSFILAFWIYYLYSINQKKGCNTASTKTYIILGFLFLLFLTIYITEGILDATYINKDYDRYYFIIYEGYYFKIQLLFIFIKIFVFIYIIIYAVIITKKINTIIPRYSNLFLYSITFIIIYFILAITAFNSISYYNGFRELMQQSSLNIYTYVVSILFLIEAKCNINPDSKNITKINMKDIGNREVEIELDETVEDIENKINNSIIKKNNL